MSIAFLFPGESAHRAGMLHRLPDTAAAAGVLAEAEAALQLAAERPGTVERAGLSEPVGVAEIDSAEALAASRAARQTAVLVAGVAGGRALTEDEGIRPDVVAGRDVGAYAAAVLSEVLTFEEALDAVRLRAVLLEAADRPETVPVRLAQRLATVPRRPQACAYVGGCRGHLIARDTQGIFDDLAFGAAHPGEWRQILDCLLPGGADRILELPPGEALLPLVTERAPDALAVSVEGDGIARAARRIRGDVEPEWSAEEIPVPDEWLGDGRA